MPKIVAAAWPGVRMRRRTATSLAAIALTSTLVVAAPAGAQNAPWGNGPQLGASSQAGDIVPGEIIIRFKDPGSIPDQVDEVGGTLERRLGVPGMVTIKVPSGTNTVALADRLSKRSDVLWAEPNTKMELNATPNDPRFGEQWGLNNTAQVIRGLGGINDIDANLPEAWNYVTGGDTVVAVVDSGVALTHPDLAPNIWENPGETGTDAQGRDRKTNGIDDDGNFLVDDWHGWDFSRNDNDPSDNNGHGTHVAGILGAVGNNGQGTAGVNWRVKIMPLKIGSESRTDTSINVDAAAAALAYAGRKGAKVVNGSFSGSNPTKAQEDAIAANPGTLYVLAAGNNSKDNDAQPSYPCNFNRENIICVGSINNQAAISSFSNFGVKSVDLGAPGGAVLSTAPFTFALDDPFEDPIAGRWTIGGNPPNGAWGVSPSPADDGTKALMYNGGNGVPANATATFAGSNLLDMSGCTSPVLETTISGQLGGTGQVAFDVIAADNLTDTNTWAVLGTASGDFPLQLFRSDLSAIDTNGDGQPDKSYAGKKMHIVFGLRNGSGAAQAVRGPVVEDVKISCVPNVLQGTEYQYLDGTSMASPMVAGGAGLVASQHPAGDMNYLKSAILGSVIPMPSLSGKTVTGGRLNVLGALDTAGPNGFTSTGPADGASTEDPRPAFAWNGTSDAKTGINRYELVVDNNTVGTTNADGRSVQPSGPLAVGRHSWTIHAIDGAGNRTAAAAKTINILPALDRIAPTITAKVGKRKRKVIASKGFSMVCTLGEPGKCTVSITVSKKDGKTLKLKPKKRAKTIAIGKATKAVGASGKATVVIKPSAKIRKAIGKARKKVTYVFTISAADAAGNKAQRITVTFKV